MDSDRKEQEMTPVVTSETTLVPTPAPAETTPMTTEPTSTEQDNSHLASQPVDTKPTPDVEAAKSAPSAEKDDGTEMPTLGTLDYLKPKVATSCYGKHIAPYMEKGTISNWMTFVVMMTGWLLTRYEPGTLADYVLAFGLFGFAGGITNWLAVKMLFDRIPGSGVIPKQFKAIRKTVKDVMLATFFDPRFLEKYLRTKSQDFIHNVDFASKINTALASETFDKLLDEKLADLVTRPEGMWLTMMGMTPEMIKPMIKPFISNMGADIVPVLTKNFDVMDYVNVHKIREQVDEMMTIKLEELTPEIVKALMEVVMRDHLGWLIVWGNVFGALIGGLSAFFGY